MYTGALENWPLLVGQMARYRPLWGNDAGALLTCRNPLELYQLLEGAGLAVPRNNLISSWLPAGVSRWVRKPVQSAGGMGVRLLYSLAPDSSSVPTYLQEFIPGEPHAAVYVGLKKKAVFLGLTKQLIGIPWLNSSDFHYCGSVGPVEPSVRLGAQLERLGDTLASACPLRGLFGVDGVIRDDVFWPVEVNPRYTASIEVLEYATRLGAMAHHRAAFDPLAPDPPAGVRPREVLGKAILFARTTFQFPGEGPWRDTLDRPGPIEDMPAFADIPPAGEEIDAGKPILTLFARGESVEECTEALRKGSGDVERWLV
jgi:predicted ATP-grasp superfamily ATP-dependent carboligase